MTVETAGRLELAVTGPFGAGLEGDDNLILKALRLLGQRIGVEPALKVTLDKRLPVASGLGGGSSDAAMALRLAWRALGLPLDSAALAEIALAFGADGPMCLAARSAWVEGIGERLSFEPRLPPLHAVLVNPGVPSPTGAVYRAYDALGPGAADMPPAPPDWSAEGVIAWLAERRNDLQAPAAALSPVIAEVLAMTAAAPGIRLARMSGSGATVFGLCSDASSAAAAAADLTSRRPDWWVQPCVLGDKAANG